MIEIIKDHTKNVDNLIGNYAYVTNSGVSINSNESCDIYDSFFLDDINDKNIVPKELNENSTIFHSPAVDDNTDWESLAAKNNDLNIGFKVNFAHQGEHKEGIVKRRKENHDDSLTRIKNSNTILLSK